MKAFFLIFLSFFFSSCIHNKLLDLNNDCEQTNSKYYLDTTNELKKIYKQDQEDRRDSLYMNEESLVKMSHRDVGRRVKVAEFFARGCLRTADDYKKAALIFQHGTIPEHFYQAYLFAKNAYQLGDPDAQHLANLAIDRFLVHSGYKQVFASQATKRSDMSCWCLYPVETSFSEEFRKSKGGKTLAEQIEWLKTLNKNNNCHDWECVMELKPVSKKDFPEFFY